MISILRQATRLGWAQTDSFVRRRLLIVVGLVVLAAAFSALAPLALKYGVDALGAAGTSAYIPESPILLICLYVICLGLSRGCNELRGYFFGAADQRLQRNISRHLSAHVLRLPMAFHLDRQTGALSHTLVQGIAGYNILLTHLTFTLLPVQMEVILIGAVIAVYMSPPFIMILLLSVAGYIIVFTLGVTKIMTPSRDVSASQVSAYGTFADSLINSEAIKYFTAEKFINRRYDRALALAESRWARFHAVKCGNGLLVVGVFSLSFGAAVLLAASQVAQGALTIGDFVLINAYMLQIIRPLERLGDGVKGAAHALGFIEKMLNILERKTEDHCDAKPCDRPSRALIAADGKPRPTQGGDVIFDRVSFGYRLGQTGRGQAPVLKDISFTVRAGTTTAIVGRSGAGKSTLIRLLLRFFEVTHGDIRLGGISVRDIPLIDLRRTIAVVPQDVLLFNDSIAYNIGFARPGSTRSEIEQAARMAHIHDRIMALPEGYQTMVGERGVKLSGGEKQRISLARAALKDPLIYVFDEATSSLDGSTEHRVFDDLINKQRQATRLIITHRLSSVLQADEILLLDHGVILERGKHDHLLRLEGAYARLWRDQERERQGA